MIEESLKKEEEPKEPKGLDITLSERNSDTDDTDETAYLSSENIDDIHNKKKE